MFPPLANPVTPEDVTVVPSMRRVPSAEIPSAPDPPLTVSDPSPPKERFPFVRMPRPAASPAFSTRFDPASATVRSNPFPA